MYNSEKILKERHATKDQADRMWDRIYKMALDGDIQPQSIGAAMHQCNKVDKALLDDEARYRHHTSALI
jgi:hypothetical protein